MKTVEEKNRMIAEFMGHIVDFGFEKDAVLFHGEHVKLSKLKFHTSWDWLMPCLSKMTTIKGFQDDYERSFHFWEAHSQFDMDGCYDELVLFIEWYNENK